MALIRCNECSAKVSDKAVACPQCGAPIAASKKGKISVGCGGLFVIIVAVVAVIAFIANDQGGPSVSGASAPPPQPVTEPAKPSVTMPQYEIVKQEKKDTPVTTRTELHAVVSGPVTEAGLRALLQKLYKASNGGFQNRGGEPNQVYIYLYTSRDHFKSEMGQWIAMLMKADANSQVEVTVRKELIAQLTAKPEVRFGLSESKRKEIFTAIARAEDRANEEAERTYPLPDPLKPGYSEAQASAQSDKAAEATQRLTAKYKSEAAKQYGLTEKQLLDIEREGLDKNWPMP